MTGVKTGKRKGAKNNPSTKHASGTESSAETEGGLFHRTYIPLKFPFIVLSISTILHNTHPELSVFTGSRGTAIDTLITTIRVAVARASTTDSLKK
jgi:hypothetical protein